MPKIPVYERAVEQQPGQPAMLRADASPEAFGAGLARGLSAGGEGMNEEIIDHQLTRLFASGKAGDLTKIGKFGIGFQRGNKAAQY